MDYVIIVAGGKGLRMGGDIPKQFLPVAGKPVLMRTLERFWEYSQVQSAKCKVQSAEGQVQSAECRVQSAEGQVQSAKCKVQSAALQIILVLPKAQQEYWHELCKEYHFDVEYQIADGGETRFHSVQNGLKLIPDDTEGVVGVHDGVRPFVSIEVIERCYEAARQHKAVIPVTPVVETLRYVGGDRPDCNVLRSNYRLVQTPQTFDIQLLKEANRQPYSEAFTDDASVVEGIGQNVTMVDGNRENIKITTPFDLKIAEALTSSSY